MRCFSATFDLTIVDLQQRDWLGQDQTECDMAEGACQPTGKVSPNVFWLQCWNLVSHPSLMAGPEPVGLRFLLCDPRLTRLPTCSSTPVFGTVPEPQGPCVARRADPMPEVGVR